jgi:alkanesulfonate monooxygenase SsuD/methylene tetrahydromethanopterin reductase-like flavin-dependent oxidoreductase (luciferase family)
MFAFCNESYHSASIALPGSTRLGSTHCGRVIISAIRIALERSGSKDLSALPPWPGQRRGPASVYSSELSSRWYRTDQAVMSPGCLQRPRPDLLLAGHGPKSLRVVARFADTWNTFGPTLDDALGNSSLLDQACVESGRDPSEVRRSVLFGIRDETAWTTAAEFADLVRRWYDAGFREFIFYDPPYAGSGLRTAPPTVVAELLETTIPGLREAFA